MSPLLLLDYLWATILCLIALAIVVALIIVLATCLHWGWLRLIDLLPEPERRGE